MKKTLFTIILALTITIQIGAVFFVPFFGVKDAIADHLRQTGSTIVLTHHLLTFKAACLSKDEVGQFQNAGYALEKNTCWSGICGDYLFDGGGSDYNPPTFLKEASEGATAEIAYSRLTDHDDKITFLHNFSSSDTWIPSSSRYSSERIASYKSQSQLYAQATGRSADEFIKNIGLINSNAAVAHQKCMDATGMIKLVDLHPFIPMSNYTIYGAVDERFPEMSWAANSGIPFSTILSGPPSASKCESNCQNDGVESIPVSGNTSYLCCCAYTNTPPPPPQEKCEGIQLQIPIIGITGCTDIATYMIAIYKVLIKFSIVLAVLILTFAGFRWIFARGDTGTIVEAKKMITNTFVGLVLALGSYTLLYAINPQLTIFKNPELEPIKAMRIAIGNNELGSEPLTCSEAREKLGLPDKMTGEPYTDWIENPPYTTR